MAGGLTLKYYYEFVNDAGIKYKVGISKKGYAEGATVIKSSPLGFSLQYNGPQSEVYQPIISSEVTLELFWDVSTKEMIVDIIASNPSDYFVVIYRWTSEAYQRWWTGIVNSEGITTPDASTSTPHELVTITADDGFGYLENVLYDSGEETYITLLEMVSKCFIAVFGYFVVLEGEVYISSCCMWFGDTMISNEEITDPLFEAYVEVGAFQQTNDFGVISGMNYREILEGILASFNLWILQFEGKWVLIQPNSYVNVLLRRWDYELPGLSNGLADYMSEGLNYNPVRFGTEGVFSNIIKSNRVTSRYQYKSSVYGDSLIPYTLHVPVTDNDFTDFSFQFTGIVTGDTLHIEGSTKTVIYHPTGDHGFTSFRFAIIFALALTDGVDDYTLNDDGDWTTAGGDDINLSSVFYLGDPVASGAYRNKDNVFNITTPACPIDGSILFTIIDCFIVIDGTDNEYTDVEAGHTLTHTTTFQNDWLASLNNDGDMSGEVGYYAELANNGNNQYDLIDAIIGDGLTSKHISRIQTAAGDTSSWSGNQGTDTLLHKLRCREMLELIRGSTKIYEGSFVGEIDMLQLYAWNGIYWIMTSGTYYAADNKFDVTLMGMELAYNDISVGLDGVTNQNSSTGGGGGSTPGVATNYWQRSGTILSPVTSGDDVQTSGTVGSIETSNEKTIISPSAIQQTGANSEFHQNITPDPLDEAVIYTQNIYSVGNSYEAAIYEEVKASGDWDATNNGVVWEFMVTPGGAVTPVSRIKVDKNGNILLNTDLKIEADGTLVFLNSATTFNDINTGINPRNTGAGRPTLASFIGNLQEFQFAVNDFADLPPIELLHGWKEGTEIEFHLHWATGGTNNETVRGVKWEIEYTCANMQAAGGVIVFPATTTISTETSIAASETQYTHKYTDVGSWTPPRKIGAQISFRIKRIASVTNTAPAVNPFLLSVGIHYEIDTLGSRTETSK